MQWEVRYGALVLKSRVHVAANLARVPQLKTGGLFPELGGPTYPPVVQHLLGGPHVALIACAILRARAWLSWSALVACPYFLCSALAAAAPAAGRGWCWCLIVRLLRPGVAGAAVVTASGRAGEG
eukprot:1150393-Pelagomonas_calceolata.AAC.1